jgi:transposase
MAGERYNEEFKVAAVKQVTEGGYSIADVAKRLGITTKSLYNWRDRYGKTHKSTKKSKPAQMNYARFKLNLNV